jgi:UDP-N-acetylmuramate dehydrogenase
MNILENHPLGQYCTFQIGGPADYFVEMADPREAIAWAEDRDVPFFVFGAGSNLLFDDEGFRGMIIRVKGGEIVVDGEDVRADAGVMMAAVVKAAADAGLTGLEEWHGLPGTVGGAVYGNAGCFGVEVKDRLKSAEILGLGQVGVDYFEYGYRDSLFKREPAFVLNATFELKKGEGVKEKMREIAVARLKKQPAGLNTGSFFKNPSIEQPAGLLIDQCGLKGERLGGMQVSEQHGNFFMNTGGASSEDVRELADLVTKRVEEKFDIALEREIIFVPSH